MVTPKSEERNIFKELMKFRGEVTPFDRPLFGRMLRLLRAYTDESAEQMADRVTNSNSAFLSSIERGRKLPTSKLINSISESYHLTESEVDALFLAADEKREFFKLKVGDAEGSAEVAYMLSKVFTSLDKETLEGLREIITSK